MQRFTLTVPLQDNSGTYRAEEFKRVAEQLLREHFDGFTLVHGVGGWKQYREPVAVYTVDAEAEQYLALLEIAQALATYAEQEAVYVTSQPISTYLVSPVKPYSPPEAVPE